MNHTETLCWETKNHDFSKDFFNAVSSATFYKTVTTTFNVLSWYGFSTVKFLEVTYTGYNDPFLTFAHSELFTALGNLFNNGTSIAPISIPEMERMAYFYQVLFSC